jgi:hypothetical protein
MAVTNFLVLTFIGVLLLSALVMNVCFGILFRRIRRHHIAPGTTLNPYSREDWFHAGWRTFRVLAVGKPDFAADASIIRAAAIGRAAMFATLVAAALLIAVGVLEVSHR